MTTEEALEESIRRWEKKARQRNPDLVELGAESCPLCRLFYNRYCRGCPVSNVTGEEECHESPYDLAIISLRLWRSAASIGRDDILPERARQFRKDARTEVEFLKSLRK